MHYRKAPSQAPAGEITSDGEGVGVVRWRVQETEMTKGKLVRLRNPLNSWVAADAV